MMVSFLNLIILVVVAGLLIYVFGSHSGGNHSVLFGTEIEKLILQKSLLIAIIYSIFFGFVLILTWKNYNLLLLNVMASCLTVAVFWVLKFFVHD